MGLSFTALDWAIVLAYVAALAVAGWLASRRAVADGDSYFLASHHAPTWLVVISVLSTTQSAATFLGAPDNAFRGDYSYLATNIAGVIAALVVSRLLIPRFYAMGATTVYELLDQRFGPVAMRAAGAMYLAGRLLASGARLYLAAIAVSMVIFLDITAEHILIASAVLTLFGVVFTLFGGLNAVIWSDLVQVVLYVGAALLSFFFLLSLIPADSATIWHALADSGKLTLIDTTTDLSKPFSLAAILTGMVLLNIGNAGLDQDTTQRFLSCEDARSGQRALILSAVAAIPVVALFMGIGSLLHIFYERPDLMGHAGEAVSSSFAGEKITVFMAFILSEIPPGLRGLVTVGIIAAAAINSGLISMSAVLVKDFWRPLQNRLGAPLSGPAEVRAGRIAVILLAIGLFGVSLLCFYWQRYADTPLLDFVLGVMTFAYSGLLGVFGVALFTRRGSSASVVAALVAGFVAVLLQQHYVVDVLGLPQQWKGLAFPWQLCIGTGIAFCVCLSGRKPSQKGAGAHDAPQPPFVLAETEIRPLSAEQRQA